jgi:cytochrome b pre-mRNA-processing protein 3
MSLLSRLFAAKPDPHEALRPLWHAVVAEARQPDWYRAGVADTVDGRFDMVTAILSAVLLRMERDRTLAQEAVFLTELFVEDMDGQLREFGVGDVIVGKRVGKLVGALGGRLESYRTALASVAGQAADVVQRNVTLLGDADANAIAERLHAFSARLDRTDDTNLLAGRFAR